MTLAPGLHANISFARYLADPCPEPSLSSSTIRDLLRSPLHAHRRHPRLGGARDDNGRADLGTAVHALVLGGSERLYWVDADDWRTKAAREARDLARLDGRVPVLESDREPIEGAARAALNALGDAALLDQERAEQTLIWREGEAWARGRPDLLIGPQADTVVDLKTATNADPVDWIRRSMIAGGYHVQAAWYLRGLDTVLPDGAGAGSTLRGAGTGREFVCLVVELDPPHGCSLVGVGPELLAIGRAAVERGVRLWKECMASGKWPGYPPAIHWADAPAWLQYEMAARGVSLSEGVER